MQGGACDGGGKEGPHTSAHVPANMPTHVMQTGAKQHTENSNDCWAGERGEGGAARTIKKCMTSTLGRGLRPESRDTGPLE